MYPICFLCPTCIQSYEDIAKLRYFVSFLICIATVNSVQGGQRQEGGRRKQRAQMVYRTKKGQKKKKNQMNRDWLLGDTPLVFRWERSFQMMPSHLRKSVTPLCRRASHPGPCVRAPPSPESPSWGGREVSTS